MSENINADVNDEDTEGNRSVFDETPVANDDDDTEGHHAVFGEAPGISGALNTGPKIRS